MTKSKNYYFNVNSKEEELRFEELKSLLSELGLEYSYAIRLLIDYRTKRASLYSDCPGDIIGMLKYTPPYESPSNLSEEIKEYVTKEIRFSINTEEFSDELVKDLDDMVRLFIKNNFRV